MSKAFKHIAIFAGMAMLFGSCQGYLNTPPADDLSPDGYYNTPLHIEQGVRGVYSILRDVELNQYLLMSEERSDNLWADPAPNGIRSCSEVSFFRFGSSMDDIKTLWKDWYNLIYNANDVLQAIDAVGFKDQKIKDQFKGELLFLRGLAHFEMARTFGNVPVIDHKLSADEAKSIPQSAPIDVIKNRAIKDLEDAEKLVPYGDEMKNYNGVLISGEGRADKIAVKALLARMYMTIKGWPYNDASATAKAKAYLEEVLKYSKDNGDKYWAPTIDEWKKQWMTDPNIANKYQIFSIQHRLSSGNPLAKNEGYAISGEYLPLGGDTGGLMTPVAPEMSLWYEYDSNNDPRGHGLAYLDGYDAWGSTPAYSNTKTKFTLEDGSEAEAFEMSINTKFCPYEQKREPLGINFDDATLGGWPLNFPVLRLEDMQLLYAEILVEEGNVSGAMGYVNKIRERAGIELVPENPDAEKALEFIKRERRLEFYLEGIRWFDQIRYGEWKETTIAKFDRYKIGGEYRQGVSDANVYGERYLSPIPYAELTAAPGLYKQNSDWN